MPYAIITLLIYAMLILRHAPLRYEQSCGYERQILRWRRRCCQSLRCFRHYAFRHATKRSWLRYDIIAIRYYYASRHYYMIVAITPLMLPYELRRYYYAIRHTAARCHYHYAIITILLRHIELLATIRYARLPEICYDRRHMIAILRLAAAITLRDDAILRGDDYY